MKEQQINIAKHALLGTAIGDAFGEKLKRVSFGRNSLAYYEPLRGALVDLLMTLRVSSTIAGFRAYRALNNLPLLNEK